MIKKKGSKHVLVSRKTGRVLGTHDTKEGALAQERAIQISKARARGHKIPKK